LGAGKKRGATHFLPIGESPAPGRKTKEELAGRKRKNPSLLSIYRKLPPRVVASADIFSFPNKERSRGEEKEGEWCFPKGEKSVGKTICWAKKGPRAGFRRHGQKKKERRRAAGKENGISGWKRIWSLRGNGME